MKDPSRPVALLFLILLLVAFVQVGWWIWEETRYTARVVAAQGAAYRRDAEAAALARRHGASLEDLRQRYPHLRFGPQGAVTVRPEALRRLEAARAHRLRRIGWEGLFFLLVLGGGMVVLYRSLRQQARLRRREENFLAAVTHELKSPLTSLRLGVETLALAEPPARTARVLRRMEEDLTRLEGLVTNVLEAARLERGRRPFRPETLPLAEAVAEVLAGLEPRRAVRGVMVRAAVPPTLRVRADREALRAVLTNLLDNAFKFAPPRDGRVEVRAAADGPYVRLTVADNGAGFPPEEAPRLFEKFYRPGSELTRCAPGTGLGLYLVRRLVESAGGHVAAASPGPGRGARFEVWWPRAEQQVAHGTGACAHR